MSRIVTGLDSGDSASRYEKDLPSSSQLQPCFRSDSCVRSCQQCQVAILPSPSKLNGTSQAITLGLGEGFTEYSGRARIEEALGVYLSRTRSLSTIWTIERRRRSSAALVVGPAPSVDLFSCPVQAVECSPAANDSVTRFYEQSP